MFKQKDSDKWWGVTWNPVVGCSPVSSGCDRCWARTNWNRFHKGEPFTPTFYPERLDIPLKWEQQIIDGKRKPHQIVMACSMGDLFHKGISVKQIIAIENVIEACPQQNFVVLTKRTDRAEALYSSPDTYDHPPDNFWLGTSAEDQPNFDKRYPYLIQVPAAKRVLSLEPLLSEIVLPVGFEEYIGWVQVGCETGSGARPCNLVWIEDIVEQCQSANVPCFIKKIPIKGKSCGDINKWPEYLRVREVPE